MTKHDLLTISLRFLDIIGLGTYRQHGPISSLVNRMTQQPGNFGCVYKDSRLWFHPFLGTNMRAELYDKISTALGLDNMFEVKRSRIKNAGMGLYTKQEIPSSRCILAYKGAILTQLEYVIKVKLKGNDTDRYSARSKYYVCDPTDSNGMLLETEKVYAHYINHCTFDTNVKLYWGGYIDIQDVMLYVWTVRKISAGEELYLDYGYEF